ncbi:MAG: CinA family protein [Clostridia bacterium]|nr:CinA family protein [Clostridia bacterium]
MKDYAKETVRLLTEKNLTITTAESCTGGLISKMITDVSGASAVFECGVVSYANHIKHSLLGVSEETLRTYGAVSEETVKEMVSGAVKISGADVAVAVSGIAGPNSDDTLKPVGLIWLAVYRDGKITTKKLNNNFTENIRDNNRNSAAHEALKLVCSVLDN